MAIFTSTSVGFAPLSGLSSFRLEERKSLSRDEEIPRKKSFFSSGVLYLKNMELCDGRLLSTKLTFRKQNHLQILVMYKSFILIKNVPDLFGDIVLKRFLSDAPSHHSSPCSCCRQSPNLPAAAGGGEKSETS